MKSILAFLILFFLVSCSVGEDDAPNIIYDKPFSIEPARDTSFYAHEQFRISWDLPPGVNNSDIQILESITPIDTSTTFFFEDLPYFSYGGQTSHFFSFFQDPNNPISDTLYVGYRIRSTDIEVEKGYSEWTEIRTFKILPLVNLNKQTIDVSYNFNFTTEEVNNEYFSGIEQLVDYDLSDIAEENNLDLEKIKVIIPVRAEVDFQSLTNEGRNPFETITFGFNESLGDFDSAYPFIPLGQVFPGSFQESPVGAQLYLQQNTNLINVMKTYPLKMAYLLEDEPNTEHQVQLNLELDFYLE